MQINHTNLEDFIRGSAFLGTGGGGDPYAGRLMLKQVLDEGRTVTIVDPKDFDDAKTAINILTMGAPTVINEKIPSGPANVAALRQAEQYLGYKVDAVMPVEAGGINASMPLVVGALTGLPVIDADGMGRAFPELQMTTYNVAGLSSNPNVIADDKNSVATISTVENVDAERYCREICVRMGGIGQMACYPLTGRQIKDHAVLNTITLAVDIGQAIREAREAHVNVVDALINFLESEKISRIARVLFDGKVTDLLRETKGGFSVGRVILDDLQNSDSKLEVVFQNEYLIAFKDSTPVAMVPDLICIVDRETGEPITTENLKYGQRVKVIGVSVPDVMRSPEALAIFGPAGFGLDVDYEPIERLGR
ncbi:DUF917 domain-containing protein [Emcibacter sp.]|uniref:DUF917 domain-containing protein n=1 Tax=Emcibacter sp. TaxID=1979954 RepID=UPI002AA91797|nr:DUF917 domain-containing protein [Emcibacter sp.]